MIQVKFPNKAPTFSFAFTFAILVEDQNFVAIFPIEFSQISSIGSFSLLVEFFLSLNKMIFVRVITLTAAHFFFIYNYNCV